MTCYSTNSSFLSRDESSFRSTSSSHNDSQNSSSSSSSMNSCPTYHHTQCVATLRSPNHHHITFLAVNNNILYAASGNEINAFDLLTLSPVPLFDGRDLSSGGFIKSISFYHEKLLTAHQDSKIRVWKNNRYVTSLPTVKDKLSRFLSPKSYVHVRRHVKKLWIQHNDAVSGLAVDENNGLIYSVSWDKCVKIWRGYDMKCLESLTAHDDAINAVKVAVTGRVYTGSADGKIRAWEKSSSDRVVKHHMVDSMETHKSTVNALALSNDGRVMLSGGGDGIIVGWEMNDVDDRMVMSGVIGGHDGAVLCLISLGRMDGRDLFVSGSSDRTVRIWGRGGGGKGCFCCLAVLEGHKRPVRSLAMAKLKNDLNDVVSVFSGSLDGEIKVWRIMVNELH